MEGIDETTTTITIEDSAENENNYERTEVEESQNSFRSEKDGEEMMNVVDMADEAKRFLRIIKKIQNQRNRACYQNLLEFAGRENKNINMDICKAIVDNLVEKKLVVNKGKIGQGESFKIVNQICKRKRSTMGRYKTYRIY